MEIAASFPGGEQSLTQVVITNLNEFPIKDSFAGVQYIFPPPNDRNPKGIPVTIPIEVAAHIFGFRPWPEAGGDSEKINELMMLYCARRHGWNTAQHQDKGLDQKFFDKVQIDTVKLRLVAEPEGKKA